MAEVDEPADIDVVLVLPEEWDMAAEVRPFEYNLISRKRVRKKYGFDVFAVRANSPELTRWCEFFAQVNVKWCLPLGIPEGTTKGLLRIVT